MNTLHTLTRAAALLVAVALLSLIRPAFADDLNRQVAAYRGSRAAVAEAAASPQVTQLRAALAVAPDADKPAIVARLQAIYNAAARQGASAALAEYDRSKADERAAAWEHSRRMAEIRELGRVIRGDVP